MSKSANRVVRFMAAGVPVAAADIPAYREVIEHGRTGYLCATSEEWMTALQALRSPEHRAQIATAAYTIAQEFTLPAIGEEYWQVFCSLWSQRAAAGEAGSQQVTWKVWAELQAAAALPHMRSLRHQYGWSKAVRAAIVAAHRACVLSGCVSGGILAGASVIHRILKEAARAG